MSIRGLTKVRTYSLLLVICGCLSYASPLQAAPAATGPSAKGVYRDLMPQNYSDEVEVCRVGIEGARPGDTAMDLLLKGRPIDIFPRSSTGPYWPEYIWGDGSETLRLSCLKENGFYLTFEGESGMRTVTGLLSKDLTYGWVIVKKWNERPTRGEQRIEPGLGHNQVLDYLTSDWPYVRKKPGRNSFSEFTTAFSDDLADETLVGYQESCRFLTVCYPGTPNEFLPEEEAVTTIEAIAANGYAEFGLLATRYKLGAVVEGYLLDIETTLLQSKSQEELTFAMAVLDRKIALDGKLSMEQVELLLGATSVTRSSVYYWNAESGFDIFDGDIEILKRRPFWADVGGFIGGFVGQLIGNNNGGSGNPITNGIALGGFCSKLAKL